MLQWEWAIAAQNISATQFDATFKRMPTYLLKIGIEVEQKGKTRMYI